jgi:serine protease Do
MPANQLQPVQMGDSNQIKVGELAIAIGNPFGLSGTMTTGIISALGRTYPVDNSGAQTGPSYTIPDVIQTDAPINPGNSGGVLVNDQGQLLGVTFAIESSTNSSSGIGFVLPSASVQRVVPSIIQTGKYEHAFIGISGVGLTAQLATAMSLDAGQRGALVEDVTPNGPAEKAGLKGSSKQLDINGTTENVGGDVITAIDGQAIKSMDNLIAYLANSTNVGQKVTLTILRDGKQMSVDVTLGLRPTQ